MLQIPIDQAREIVRSDVKGVRRILSPLNPADRHPEDITKSPRGIITLRGGVSASVFGAIWEDFVPEITPKDVLLAYLPHLRAASIPPVWSRKESDLLKANLGTQALLGVAPLGFYAAQDQNLLMVLIRIWPHILSWCEYVFAAGIVADDLIEEHVPHRVKVLVLLLHHFGRNDDLRSVIADTPGTVELGAHLWARQELLSPDDRALCASVLQNLLWTGKPHTFERFFSRVGGRGKAKTIAKRAHRQLRTAMKSATLRFDNLALNVGGIHGLSCDTELRGLFLRMGMIGTVTKVLVLVSRALDIPDEVEKLQPKIECMNGCLRYLSFCMPDTSGVAWAYQAVQHGHLSAFVDCSKLFHCVHPKIRPSIFRVVTEWLPRFLIYRSLITIVGVAFEDIIRNGRWDGVDGTPAEEPWNSLRELAASRLSILLRSRKSIHKSYPCGNLKCDKVDPSDTFLKCSKCLRPCYCSSECQLVDWKDGHITNCHRVADNRKPRPEQREVFSDSDLDFIRFMTGQMIFGTNTQSASFAARELGIPRTDQILVVDWEHTPIGATVTAISLVQGKYGIAPDVVKFKLMVDDYRSCMDKQDLMIVVVPYGMTWRSAHYLAQNATPRSKWIEHWRKKLQRVDPPEASLEQRAQEREDTTEGTHHPPGALTATGSGLIERYGRSNFAPAAVALAPRPRAPPTVVSARCRYVFESLTGEPSGEGLSEDEVDVEVDEDPMMRDTGLISFIRQVGL